MRSRVVVQSDGLGSTPLTLDRLCEESLGRGDIALGAKPEIDSLSCPVNCTVKIDPFATDLHIRLVDSPRPTGCRSKAIPALDELRREPLDPTHDRRVRKQQAALGHHFDKVSKAQLVTQVSFQPFSATTRRTEAVVVLGERTIRCVKGALRTVAEAAGLDAGAITEPEGRANTEAQNGERVLAIARADNEGSLKAVGLAYLYDAPRPDSRRLIDELSLLGVRVKMLTGDALPVARAIAGILRLGTIIRAPDLHASPQKAEGRGAI